MKLRYAIVLVAVLVAACEQTEQPAAEGDDALQPAEQAVETLQVPEAPAATAPEGARLVAPLSAPPPDAAPAAEQEPTIEAAPEIPLDYEPPPEESSGVIDDSGAMPMEAIDNGDEYMEEFDHDMSGDPDVAPDEEGSGMVEEDLTVEEVPEETEATPPE